MPIFEDLPEPIVAKVLENARLLECAPGDQIIEEGAQDDSLVLLLSGKVRVRKEGVPIAAAWEPGSLLGEMAALRTLGDVATYIANQLGQSAGAGAAATAPAPSAPATPGIDRAGRKLTY